MGFLYNPRALSRNLSQHSAFQDIKGADCPFGMFVSATVVPQELGLKSHQHQLENMRLFMPGTVP